MADTQTTLAPRPYKIIGVTSFMNAAGAQEALLRLSRQLRARGHDTQVWFLYEEAPVFRGEPHTYTFVEKPKLSAVEYLKVFLALRSRIARERPDAVIGFLPLGEVYGALAALLAGVRVRIASQRAPGPTFGKAMRLLDKLWGALGVYRRVVCVSEAVERSFDTYPAAYRKKLSVVHNGIEWTPSALSKAEARDAFGLPQDAVVFLALGRMKAQKNYAFLIERIAETPGTLFVIGGDGEQRPMVEALIAERGVGDRVRLLGNVDRDGVRVLFKAADAFIMTSLYEGQSNAVLEAMNAGVAQIVSDIPMNRETLCDEAGVETGLLPSLDDAQAWRNGMARLRDDPVERDRLAAAAQSLVERRFGLAAMIDGFERMFVEEIGR